MELKKYQKQVIDDLCRFLYLLSEKQSIRQAYDLFWEEKGISVGLSGMLPYHTVLPGVPHVCLKVPTGGGKTFLASNAIKPIFDSMTQFCPKTVVWLVPSEAILKQTVNNLMNMEHPYRKKINVDFCGNVQVYTKEELLSGQNFNPVSVVENLSIFILTYDSFRTSKKDGRKAFQQNGKLKSFGTYKKDMDILLADVDDTALIQIIRKLNPVVIVDESHHAASKLSIEMLGNFNPCFVLELTATPKSGSNIISFVDARQLKVENMVKLPVIVYNQRSQKEVLLSAISLRQRLELEAIQNEEETGRYIRPIVLLQAESRISENNTTYEKIRSILLEFGIPEEQIAIKTGDRDDIKNVDLSMRECKIRFIITVNALKEGWDCPFAYILATVANRSSVVDVTQILGRVLRLPYTKSNKNHQMLNLSYVITSSADFYGTLDKVVEGLYQAGFSKKDYRTKNTESISDNNVTYSEQIDMFNYVSTNQNTEEKINDVVPFSEDITAVSLKNIKERDEDFLCVETKNKIEGEDIQFSHIVDSMIDIAIGENLLYSQIMEKEGAEPFSNVPDEVKSRMSVYYVKNEFREDIKNLKLPQFVIENDYGLFSEQTYELLDRENLRKNFTLHDKDTKIDFDSMDADIAKIDIKEGEEIPKAWKLRGFDNEAVKEWFDSRPSETKRRLCKDRICTRLSKINALDDSEIKDYVDRIMLGMTESQIAEMERMPEMYVAKIKEKVENLLTEHEAGMFRKWLEQDYIQCQPMYVLSESITPIKTISSIPKSLYKEEDGNLNDYERKVVWELSGLNHVRWWHRNISRKGFAINGAVTAYPDLMVMLESGKLLLIETKGDHLNNDESKAKAELGSVWANMAGRMYKYYMVFETKRPDYVGAYSYDEFIDIVKGL